PGRVSRREFGLSLAALAATPLVRASTVSRAEGVVANSTSNLAPPQGSDDKVSPEAEALGAVVRLRYGKELSEEQMGSVKASLNNRINASARLKEFKLENGDEPAFVFSASPE
ncbi:MAG TPA: hypothetical protein VEZ90_18700, partial [Blastocatellia bacterium]|nr:hypothetical protein [Blastocatellia bacterium]